MPINGAELGRALRARWKGNSAGMMRALGLDASLLNDPELTGVP
jgi:hypothetical protein